MKKRILCLAMALALLLPVAACRKKTTPDITEPAVTPTQPGVTDNGTAMGEYDVIVVGGGLAGLSAAIKSAEEGANVILFEKLSYLGGNSILATGIFYVGGTSIQEAAGMTDTKEAFYEDAMKASENRRDPVQTRIVADYGADTIAWLQSLGVEFSQTVTPAMGSPVARAHQALPNSPGYFQVLEQVAREKGVNIELDTSVAEVMFDGNTATGIVTDDGKRYDGASVILAVGGFGADPDRFVKYTPSAQGILYAGSPGTTGELIEQVINLGAATTDIDVPFLTPTVELEKKQLLTSLLLSKGGILVNAEGKRFTDETASYYKTGTTLLELGVDYVWEIFDDQVRESVYKVDEYVTSGLVHKAETIEELAAATNIDVNTLKATIEEYNKSVADPSLDVHGRTIFATNISKAPFYYAKVMTGTIMTPGGLSVNDKFLVVKEDGSYFNNLYAVGETAGGYRAYGYIGGDSLAHAAVSGMLAGGYAVSTTNIDTL